MTADEIQQLSDDGGLTRLRRGAYGAPLEESPEQRHKRLILGTVPFMHPSNVFSHTSAAILHGLPVRRASLEVVTILRGTTGHGNGGTNLRARNTRFARDQVTQIDELPTTTLARTVCDQARLEPFEWGVATADAALRRGLTREELYYELARFPRLHAMKRGHDAIRFADGLAESPAESLSRVQIARLGLPEPVAQYEVFDDNGQLVARADFGWPEHGLLGEVDGEIKYGALLRPNEKATHVLLREKQREQRLRRLGWWVIRWGWQEANHRELLAAIILDGFQHGAAKRA